MPKQQTDYLLQLVRSLTRAEKRHFRLFANRNQSSGSMLFLQLFDVLDKYKRYDEGFILERIPGIKKRQLSNVKGHLYRQLLLSLRLLYRNQRQDIELRERLDYARILYEKGLYMQALEVLDKTKSKAIQSEMYHLALEIIDFEKLIESQYVTYSKASRVKSLAEETRNINQRLSGIHDFSNLSLQLYELYLKMGCIRNAEDYDYVCEYFEASLPEFALGELGFLERVYLYQAHSWYSYIIQDFLNYYRFAQKLVDLFEQFPNRKELDYSMYLKSRNTLLTALFMLWQDEKIAEELEDLEQLYAEIPASKTNERTLLFQFIHIHRINLHYIRGTFSEGLEVVPELMTGLEQMEAVVDDHRRLVFYYKVACLYFGSGDNEQAIHYLNLIINEPNSDLREDIQCFARILNLIAHFELGNDRLVEYQVKSVYRFLRKRDDLQQVQLEVLAFIRKIPSIRPIELNEQFRMLRDRLAALRSDPYERRPFLYLDIISWLESKIQSRTVQEVIQDKYKAGKKPWEVLVNEQK